MNGIKINKMMRRILLAEKETSVICVQYASMSDVFAWQNNIIFF